MERRCKYTEKSYLADEGGEDGLDRISDMPVEILNHILSFLPAEDTFRTSFLSKKWKSLWSPRAILDLDFGRFAKHSSPGNHMKRFSQFVGRMIVLHEECHLKEFRLSLFAFRFNRNSLYTPQIDNWIRFGMTRDCTTLDLDFWGRVGDKYCDSNDSFKYHFPQHSVSNQFIQVLRLRCCHFVVSSNYTSFVSVKTAILKSVHLPAESVYNLVGNSPCLEELHLIRCIIPEDLILHCPESKLTLLVLESCWGHHDSLSTVDIRVPKLIRFKYVGQMMANFDLDNPNNLIDVELDILSASDDFEAEDADMDYHSVILQNLLASISRVTNLTLSKWCFERIIYDPEGGMELLRAGDLLNRNLPPPLHNLQYLTLKFLLESSYISTIACLLRCSPHLHTLTLDLTGAINRVDMPTCIKVSDPMDYQAWSFMFSHCLHNLETIKLLGFEGRNSEMRFVKGMLEFSVSLKEVVISEESMKSRYASAKQRGEMRDAAAVKLHQRRTIQKLLKFPRASSDARISLV